MIDEAVSVAANTAVPEPERKEAFLDGTLRDGWRYFGPQMERTEDGGYLYTFRVWAPDAAAVALVGTLSDWDAGLPMDKEEGGIWCLTLPSKACLEGAFYKFAITDKAGEARLKADPWAKLGETQQNTASILHCEDTFTWTDGEWLKKRRKTVCPKLRGFRPRVNHFYSAPLHIYEMHLGSWRKDKSSDGKDEAGEFLNYRAIADQLVPYLTDMGYTHVELLPVMEHPFDGSLGYQTCGYFAPTSRYGMPEDFRYFVNALHEAGIGVILDWVPTFFPKDRHGLYRFDGTELYEAAGSDTGDSCYFAVDKPEVRAFLVSCALYWLTEYHADGLKCSGMDELFDASYNKAADFFRYLCDSVREDCPDALLIADLADTVQAVTEPTEEGGLGFSFRWSGRFTKKILEYMRYDPIERRNIHGILTEPGAYIFDENHILPFAHTDMQPGQKSIVDKMFGEYDDKFSGMRTMMLYTMTMPGKKLTFMGSEFAQFREWDYKNQLEWFMIEYPRHVEMQRFFRALGQLYVENAPLWEIDDTVDGLVWLDKDCEDWNVLAYSRRDKKGRELIVLLNFSPVPRPGYTFCVPKMGRYEEILTTDRYEFGGKNRLNEDGVRSVAVNDENGVRRNRVQIDLPALGGIVLQKQIGG